MEEFIGTGRRKTAVSSVRLRPGSGQVRVNDRPFEEYFTLELQRNAILQPIKKINGEGKYDLVIRAHGGGIEGQVIATRLGLSRALVRENEERRSQLKELGFLTRDPRKRERKKYGQKGARKRFQFSKR
jgi:small subunit ribosomal protein S9